MVQSHQCIQSTMTAIAPATTPKKPVAMVGRAAPPVKVEMLGEAAATVVLFLEAEAVVYPALVAWIWPSEIWETTAADVVLATALVAWI